jgi:regulator of RNase E activity RraA
MSSSNQDDQLFSMMKEKLFTSVVGDVMDAMGYTHQFLPSYIKAIDQNMVLAGRALTVLEADCTGTRVEHQDKDHAFGVMFHALDSIKKNDVYICTGSLNAYANWGELMSTRATQLGGAGAVVSGYSRDTHGMLRMGFPAFSRGNYGQDQGVRGRVIDYNCPIEFENHVTVQPGDIVFGDIDGVVIIPKTIEKEVIQKAIEKVDGENKVKTAIENGMSTVEAWETFGIM